MAEARRRFKPILSKAPESSHDDKPDCPRNPSRFRRRLRAMLPRSRLTVAIWVRRRPSPSHGSRPLRISLPTTHSDEGLDRQAERLTAQVSEDLERRLWACSGEGSPHVARLLVEQGWPKWPSTQQAGLVLGSGWAGS